MVMLSLLLVIAIIILAIIEILKSFFPTIKIRKTQILPSDSLIDQIIPSVCILLLLSINNENFKINFWIHIKIIFSFNINSYFNI